jgi:DHA3 family tetracycline resistance protein-like MFS transporter
MRGSQLGQVGALAGIGLGVGLATISLALPLIAGGAMFVALAAFLIVVMPERGFRQSQVEDRGSFSEMWTTFTSGVRVVRMRHVLLAIIAAELFIGISSEPYDRLWALHMLDTFEFPSLFGLDPVTWFGVMSAGALLIGIGATGLIRKIFDLDEPRTPRRLLLATNAAMIAATLAFALSGSFGVAAAMVIAISVLRRISDPITDAWLNKHVDSSHRATVFSLHGQTNAFGQAALGPAMGVIATLTTLRAALVGVAVLLVPPQVIYAFVRGSGTTNHNENRKESHETD